mgnify:CR=1 FL=1
MNQENKKFMSVSTKSALVNKASDGSEQEHQITFVASSANPDRAKEIVEIGTFKLPLKGGGFVRVAELASTPNAKLDIPFLANHDGWDIDSVLGSVRSAVYDGEKKELTFTVGLSSRDKAQEMFRLVAEGHLDNAFSIGWRGGAFNPDTKTYTEGEMLEVSLVTRGCNYDARVVNAKSVEAIKTDDEADNTQEPTEQDTHASMEAEHAPEEENHKSNQETEKIMDGKETNQEEIAKKQVVEAPSQKSTITISQKNYLDTPEAMADLAKHIHANYGKSNEAVVASWKEHLATKGLTGSEILPTTLAQAFFNCFERKDGVLAKFRSTKVLAGAAYAFSTSDKAGAHTKGDKKGYITPKSIRRDWKHKIAYAKMELDLQDLLDDQTGELTQMRAEMLAERLYTRILEAFVTEAVANKPSGADTRMFDGTRGVFSFKADLDRSVKTGNDDDILYAKAIANVIANDKADNLYDKIVKVIRGIKGTGEKAIFVPDGTMTDLMLSKDNDGRYLFPVGSNTENLLKATVVELESMDDCGYDVIGVNCGNILYAHGADMLRAAFDHEYNRDVLLHEKSVAGTAQGWKSIAGYASAGKTSGGEA